MQAAPTDTTAEQQNLDAARKALTEYAAGRTTSPSTSAPQPSVIVLQVPPQDASQPTCYDPKPMGFGFLAFATLLLILMTWSMLRIRNHLAVLRAFGLLLIISASVYLVVAGYSEKQITPVLGLLGTIGGYLLGRAAERESASARGSADNAG